MEWISSFVQYHDLLFLYLIQYVFGVIFLLDFF